MITSQLLYPWEPGAEELDPFLRPSWTDFDDDAQPGRCGIPGPARTRRGQTRRR